MGASQTSSDEVAQRLGTSPPPPRDDDGGDNLAPGGVRQAKDEAVADHAGGPDLVEYLTGGDLEPARVDDVVDAPVDDQAPTLPMPEILGGQPRPDRTFVEVAAHDHRPGDAHPAVVGQVDPYPFEWHPVIDAPAAGLAHAVGHPYRDASLPGPRQQRRRRGGPADEHRGTPGQGLRPNRVVEEPRQLGRHHRYRHPAIVMTVCRLVDGCRHSRSIEAPLDHHDLATVADGSGDDLQPSDVMGRQGQHPRAWPSQALPGGRTRGSQLRRRQSDETPGPGG